MIAYYTDHFVLPLNDGHRFPMDKYRRLRERVSAELDGLVELRVPEPVRDVDVLRAHDGDYVQRVVYGTLDPREVRRIGFPWTPELVERSRRSSGGTLAACRAALGGDGVSVNLAGGTHHSFADHGEGFCVWNDAAISIRALQEEGRIQRAIVIDCDAHQGNGTAAIFRDDPSVFSYSIHSRLNYPFRKEVSDLDVPLDDGTEDGAYLEALADSLTEAFARADADLAIYVSGADPWEGDRLGRLSLSKDGLRRRDEYVLEACRRRDIPIAVAMAGGYAKNIDDIVDIHFTTVRTAAFLGSRSETSS